MREIPFHRGDVYSVPDNAPSSTSTGEVEEVWVHRFFQNIAPLCRLVSAFRVSVASPPAFVSPHSNEEIEDDDRHGRGGFSLVLSFALFAIGSGCREEVDGIGTDNGPPPSLSSSSSSFGCGGVDGLGFVRATRHRRSKLTGIKPDSFPDNGSGTDAGGGDGVAPEEEGGEEGGSERVGWSLPSPILPPFPFGGGRIDFICGGQEIGGKESFSRGKRRR